ncbi:hypothetical protein IQ07DRAFT_601710 [Pyrenochaeta sp. DS3sAY3a]|nr:hypothetical protein IQ07DRAFT_601710 [Pyrenochaeta sp. DS3sAY3a]
MRFLAITATLVSAIVALPAPTTSAVAPSASATVEFWHDLDRTGIHSILIAESASPPSILIPSTSPQEPSSQEPSSQEPSSQIPKSLSPSPPEPKLTVSLSPQPAAATRSAPTTTTKSRRSE